MEKENNPKVRVKPINREQTMLRSVDVEELIPADHSARAIWELTGKLDLSRYYSKIESVDGGAGRAAFDPRLLISVWIYAYSEGEGSAREVSRLCETEPAYQWLTGLEGINHHTLSDFRVAHEMELDHIFIQVLGVLSAEGLVELKRVMQDGTKIRANAGGDGFRREGRIQEHLRLAQEQVKAMGDPRQEGRGKAESSRKRAAQEWVSRLQRAQKELEKIRETKKPSEAKGARASTTDPEARIMKNADGGYIPAYTVQITTDSKEGVIVGVGVTQSASDYEELARAVDRVEANLGKKPDQVVADGGYTSAKNIVMMKEKGVDFIGSPPDHTGSMEGQMRRRGVDPGFYPDRFQYDGDGNRFICPAGKILKYEASVKEEGYTTHDYRAASLDCLACPFKLKCCPGNAVKGRSLRRREDDAEVVAFKQRMWTEEAKAVYKQRGGVAEFSNLWIKAKNGLRQFHVRGVIKVRMEAMWAALACNIQQWIRLRWKLRMASI